MTEAARSYRLVTTVRGGANNHPLASVRYESLEAARAAARQLMHENNRVMRIMILSDENGNRFQEWIERS